MWLVAREAGTSILPVPSLLFTQLTLIVHIWYTEISMGARKSFLFQRKVHQARSQRIQVIAPEAGAQPLSTSPAPVG
jgi:hypothetical protein